MCLLIQLLDYFIISLLSSISFLLSNCCKIVKVEHNTARGTCCYYFMCYMMVKLSHSFSNLIDPIRSPFWSGATSVLDAGCCHDDSIFLPYILGCSEKPFIYIVSEKKIWYSAPLQLDPIRKVVLSCNSYMQNYALFVYVCLHGVFLALTPGDMSKPWLISFYY